MTVPFPGATWPAASRTEVFLRYLRYFRDGIGRRVEAMDDDELRRSRVPSGWTPLELVQHLTLMERRWFVWGFEGQPVSDPFGDEVDGRWVVLPEVSAAEVIAAWRRQAQLSDQVLDRHDLDEIGRSSERWHDNPAPTLERVVLHVLQEYSRHLGHLDIVAELAGGVTGET